MFLPKFELLEGFLPSESWIWILLAIVILFGGKKIPELAKGLGKGIREFKDAKDGIKEEIEKGINDRNTPPTPKAPQQIESASSPTPIEKETVKQQQA